MPAYDAVFYDTNMAAIFGAIRFARDTGGSALCIGPDKTRGGTMASQIHGSDEAAQGHAHWGLYNEFNYRLINELGYTGANALNGPDSVKWYSPKDAQLVIDMLLTNTGSGTVTFLHRNIPIKSSVVKDAGGFVSITFRDIDTDAETVIESSLWSDCSPLADLAAIAGGYLSSVREAKSTFDEFIGGNVDNINGNVIGNSQVRDSRGSIRWKYQYPTEIPDQEADKNTEPYNIRPCVSKHATRISFAATPLVATEATAGLTSITTTTSTIVASAGSWITAGFAVNDVVILTGHSTAANNNKPLNITALTASTMTVAQTLVADGVADTAFTVTRLSCKPPNYHRGDFLEYIAWINASGYTAASQLGLNTDQVIGNPANLKYATNFGDIGGPLSWRYPNETFEERERLKTELVYQWLGKLYTAAQDSGITSSVLKADVATFGLCSDEHDDTTNNPAGLVRGMPEIHYTRGDRRIYGRRIRQWKDVWGTDLDETTPEPGDPYQTVTITIASPGVVTDTAHGMSAGQKIKFTTTGALPTGLTAGTTYYVKTVSDANSYTVSATNGGSAINTSGSQSGTHTRDQILTAARNWPYTAPVADALWWNGYAFDIHHGRDAALADGSGYLSCVDYRVFPETSTHRGDFFGGASYIGVGLDEIRFGKGICDNLVVPIAHSQTRPCWAISRLDPGYCSGGEGSGLLLAFCFLNSVSPGDVAYDQIADYFIAAGAPHSYEDIENFDPDFPAYPPL